MTAQNQEMQKNILYYLWAKATAENVMEFMKIINQEKKNKNSAFLCLLNFDLMAKAYLSQDKNYTR